MAATVTLLGVLRAGVDTSLQVAGYWHSEYPYFSRLPFVCNGLHQNSNQSQFTTLQQKHVPTSLWPLTCLLVRDSYKRIRNACTAG